MQFCCCSESAHGHASIVSSINAPVDDEVMEGVKVAGYFFPSDLLEELEFAEVHFDKNRIAEVARWLTINKAATRIDSRIKLASQTLLSRLLILGISLDSHILLYDYSAHSQVSQFESFFKKRMVQEYQKCSESDLVDALAMDGSREVASVIYTCATHACVEFA